MGVFAIAAGATLFREAALAAAYELGLFDASASGARTVDELAAAVGITRGTHRVRALVDALVAIGVLVRVGEGVACGNLPPRPEVVREGWGRLAEVMREDRPLPLGSDPTAFHHHLLRAGADSAREVARLVTGTSYLDLGGGAGVYTAALLDAHPAATATIVDFPEAIALARVHLARFGDRVRFVEGDAREAALEADHDAVVLANLLHLHGPLACAELCAAAARAVRPGGAVAIVELRSDSPEGLWFALDMALYTERGDVYPTRTFHDWLADAGLIELVEHRLTAAPENVVVVGRRPRGAGRRFADHTGLRESAERIDADEIGELAMPAALRRTLSHAVALEGGSARGADLLRHYTVTMPAQRAAQRSDGDPLFVTPLAWDQLPRLSAALDRLFALLAETGVDPALALGAPTASAFRGRTPTLAALYERTHYGGMMPLLYGSAADLAYFRAHGGDDPHEVIDRYLTTPILHELCHLARDRDALHPLHLDECVAGWLGVHVHREFAYPAPGHDDAIFAAPWLSQIGQALARAFGIRAVIRGHGGAEPWDAALPASFVDAAVRLGWDDWCARRSLHFLSNTLDPAPWVALALVAGAGGDLTRATLADLAATRLSELALPPDPDFDRAIVEDALRAMCLETALVDGSFRARTALPRGSIAIEAAACTMTSARRGEVDTVDPRYWIPPAVGAQILAAGRAGYRVRLTSIDAIPAAAVAITSAARPGEYPGFALG